MTRMRKVTIEIAQREISLTINLDAAVSQNGPQEAAGTCPTCGAPLLLTFAAAVMACTDSQLALLPSLVDGEVHLIRSGGCLWLCERSFERLLAISRTLANPQPTIHRPAPQPNPQKVPHHE
jgi:hypothetical protein